MISPPNLQLRYDAIRLYKTLLHMGRDYPQGYGFFRDRLKRAFLRNAGLAGEPEVRRALARGEYVVRELEALYYLRRYRALRRGYGDNRA